MPLIPGGGRARFRAEPPPPGGLGVNTIWFDDFEEDIGWNPTPTGTNDYANAPSRWDYVLLYTGYRRSIQAGVGRSGSAGLVIELDPGVAGQKEIGRLGVTFPESTTVHTRAFMKTSEGFKFGRAGTSSFWKQWRMQQSPWVRGLTPPFGTNGEDNTGYAVTTLGIQPDNLGYDSVCCWRGSTGNSAGGAQCMYRQRAGLAPSGNQPFGTPDVNGQLYDCDWVQIDQLLSLGEDDQDNGVIAFWINGVQINPWNRIAFYGGSVPITGNGLVTNNFSHNGYPPGYNTFTFIDNLNNMTLDWTEQHYMYVDSVYIYDGMPNDLTLV